MFKYIKWQIKGSYKFMLSIILAIVVSNLILFNRIYNLGAGSSNLGAYLPLLVMGLTLIIFCSFIAIFINLANLFNNDLKSSNSYISWVLPLKRKEVFLAKYLTAIFWVIIIAICLNFTSWLGEKYLIREAFNYGNSDLVININTGQGLVENIGMIFDFAYIIMIMYFSMIFNKAFLSGEKGRNLWFFVFLAINFFQGWVRNFLTKAYPYYIDWAKFKIYKRDILDSYNLNLNIMEFENSVSNIAVTAFVLLGLIILYFLGSYILEKKVDL